MRAFNLHPKSLITGLAVGLLVLSQIGADPPATPPSQGDRYELSAWANQDGHGAFVLNTRTGEVVSIIGRTVSAAEGANVDAAQKRVGLYSVQPVQR